MVVITAPCEEAIAVDAAQFLWRNGIPAGVVPDGNGFIIQVFNKREKAARQFLLHWAREQQVGGK